MKVKALQLFLNSLLEPVQSSGASAEIVSDLKNVVGSFEPFANETINELAAFLVRSQKYEQEGKWPESNPPIIGQVVDAPSPKVYAERLRSYLQKVVSAEGAVAETVLEEMDNLKTVMKLPQLRKMAISCGVTGGITSAQKAIEKTFEHITNRNLPDVIIETHAHLLSSAKDHVVLGQRIEKADSALNATQAKKLAKTVGVTEKINSKSDAFAKIRAYLANPQTNQPAAPHTVQAVISPEKINRVAETLRALKEKADPENAPEEEINEELQRLAGELSKEEAIAAAKEFGVVWGMNSKDEAMKRIHEKVFARKHAREKIYH